MCFSFLQETTRKSAESLRKLNDGITLIEQQTDENRRKIEKVLDAEIKSWMAFAAQKLVELGAVKQALAHGKESVKEAIAASDAAAADRLRPLVELGGEDRIAAKVLSLKAVLAAYRRGNVAPTTIDVSAPDRPLARPRLSS